MNPVLFVNDEKGSRPTGMEEIVILLQSSIPSLHLGMLSLT